MLILLLQTGFVLVAALVAGLFARRSPATRSAIYRASILAAVAIVVASPWLREREKPVVPIAWAPPVTTVTMTSAPASKAAAMTKSSQPTKTAAISDAAEETTVEMPEAVNVWQYLPLVWQIGVGLFALQLGLGYLALASIRRSSRPVQDPRVLEALAETAKLAKVAIPAVVEGSRIVNPFVAGVLKPTIYLPSGWYQDADDDTLRALLRHEIAHVSNGDLGWSLIHRLACIVFWPQVFLWMLRKPMSAVGEELCDRKVLASGIPSARYAECLLNLRDRSNSRLCPTLGIGAVSSRSFLSRRVEAILDGRTSRSVTLPRGVSVALRGAALIVAGSGAYLFARPASVNSVQDPYSTWVTKPYSGKVRLVSPDGRPVLGAAAWLVITGDVPDAINRPLRVQGSDVLVSGDRLPPRTRGTLIVRAKGLGLGFKPMWPAPQSVVELRMPASVGLRGKLSLPNGQPAAGIKVRAQQFAQRLPDVEGGLNFAVFSSIKELDLSAVTHEDGSFVMEGLPPKATMGYDVEDDRFAVLRMTSRPTTPVSGIGEAKPVKLAFAGSISGRVVRNGKPFAGLRIGAQGNHERGIDDADLGGFAVTGADGRYTLKRMGSGIVNVIADLRGALEKDMTAVAHEAITIKPGQNVTGIDFDLVAGVIVEGTVSDLSGKPVAETYVGVYGPAHPQSSAWVQSAFTDAGGRYRFRVPPGKQYVYVSDSRYQSEPQRITIERGTSARVDFQVTAAKPETTIAADRVEMTEEEEEAIRQREEADKGPVPPVASFGPGKPFYGPVKLPNGATVRLVYVQDDIDGPHHLWQPDGSPARKADIASSLDLEPFGNKRLNPRSIFLRVEIDGVPRGDYSCVVQVPHPSSWSVWQTYGDRHDQSKDLASFRAPETLRVTDMRFGVAAGAPTRIPLTLVRAISAKPLAATVKDATVTVRVPEEMEGADVQMVAYDANGTELRLESFETESGKDKTTGLAVRTFSFNSTGIAKAELLVRPYQWATFKGIQLHPRSR